MNSLTYKLASIFLVIALIPLFIGINGTMSLKTAEGALNENNRALQDLNRLLASAESSLSENVALQGNAKQTTGQIAATQEATSESLREMGDSMLPRAFAISEIRYALSEAASAERALLLAVNMRHLEGADLDDARTAQRGNIAQAIGRIDDARHTYMSMAKPGEDETAWREFESALADWNANHNEFMSHIDELNVLVEDLIRGGPLFAAVSRKAYDTLFVTGRGVRLECEKRIAALNQTLTATAGANVQKAMASQAAIRSQVEELGRESDAAAAQANALLAQFETARGAATRAAADAEASLNSTSSRFWYMAVFSLIGVVVAVAVGLVQSWRITKPIRNMVTHLSRLAAGDFGLDVPASDRQRKDEIGQLASGFQDLIHASREEIRMANAMANGDYTTRISMRSDSDELGRALAGMITITNETLGRVSRAVGRVGNGAASVSEASRSLSHGAQTSATALEEISQTVNEVDGQAQDNAQHAREANELATASRDAAKRGYNAVTELVASMREIQESGRKIASVAKLIDDIAFQTNLLALNAAVEAARAGRQGRGFTVVADEVRSLSGRSAKAARETSEMVAAMTEKMEMGSQLAIRTDHEFRDIVEATDQVAKLFDDIAHASSAQSTAMAQIAQGVGQIDSVVQENTTNATLTASSAQALSRQAEELRRMVSRFRLNSTPEAHPFPLEPRDSRDPRTGGAAAVPLADERSGQLLLSGPDGDYDE